MTVPNWENLSTAGKVLKEPPRGNQRAIFWVPTDADRDYQYWERVGTVPRSEVQSAGGIASVPATSIRARQRVGGGLLGRLTRSMGRSRDEAWSLPGGESVEKCGERVTDLVLAWPENVGATLDEAVIRTRWPNCTRILQLGDRLFLVSGIHGRPAEAVREETPGGVVGTEEIGCPVALAEQLLERARQSGDRSRETSALIDLGIVMMNEGDLQKSVSHLDKALGMARELGDPSRETDALSNLGYALLAMGQTPTARQALEQAYMLAQRTGDAYAEKLVLERLGMAHANLRDPVGALKRFDRALEMTRAAGDRQQETRLLWHMAIALADMNQRDQAIARAQESIDLLRHLGKPEASWYGAQLQRYRMDFATLGSSVPGVAGTGAATADAPSGPGLLRMAVSATKAMMKFIASGLKSTPPAIQQKRMAICQSCAHHTGLRCRICGCFTNVKTRMAHERCPIGQWPE
jgi:tetratricopeptide (TPR) repeat protein